MASIIKIKRSTGSAAPGALGSGELAYAWDEAGGFQNGKMYVGTGAETAGAAANIEVVGGKYFTNMMDHTLGTVTASSAVLVDGSKKVNEWLVDNITLDGNTISTTDANGNLVLAPNGSGLVSIAGAYTLPRIAGTAGFVLSTDGAGTASWTQPPASSFTINGNTGTDSFSTGQTLTITGAGALSTAVTDNTVTLNVVDATTAVKGVASFATANFTVSGGAVSIKAGGVPNTALVSSTVTVGTTAIALGASSTTLAGLTSVTSTGFTGALTGNASTATTLQTARTIAISGPITGTATSFNGSANITIPVTSLDVAHTSVTGTLAVDHGGTGVTTSTGTGSVVLNASPALTGTPTVPTAAAGTNTTQIASTAFVRTEVDNARVGIDAKESVVAATTANITLSNTQTVDGVALAVGNRVLVKNQTNAAENGIYIVSGAAWTRAPDAITGTLTPGAFVFIESGGTNADSGWVLSTTGAVTVGTTPLTFAQFSGAGQITAGNGLTKIGNTLDVGAGTGITVEADTVGLSGQALAVHNLGTNGIFVRTGAGTVAARTVAGTANRVTVTNGDGVSGNPTVDIASTYAGQNTITTLGTITTGVWAGTDVEVTHGGTGVSSLGARGVLFGNGTAAVGVTAASGSNGSFLREDATGNPYWSNIIDGGTY
jgi:hypothetical protein